MNVLYLAHRVPYPPDKGDRIRTYHILRFLAQRAEVHLASLADESVGDDALAALRALCAQVAVIPLSWSRWLHAAGALLDGRSVTEGAFHSPALVQLVTDWCDTTRFDAVVVSASSLVPYLRLPALRDVPAVVDLMDVDSQKWLDYAAASHGPRAWLYAREGATVRRLEAGLPAEFRAVMLVSPAEAELYRRFAQPGRIEAIRNGVDLDYFQPEPAIEETNCVFVGALDYRPNVDGIVWFCREVWPGIQRRKPQTKLYLVGRRPSKAVQQLAQQPGVVLIGQVADVRPYVSRAAVVVVPLRLARGLQNKVLEALAQGKAVVASPPALAALETEAGVHLLTASAPVEWEAAVLRLLDDAELRQRLGTAGRRYVENHHAWQTCLQPFAELLGSPARNGQSGDMQAPYTGTTLKETIAVNVNGRSFRVVAGRNRDFWDQVAKGVWEPQTFAILEQFLDAHHAYIDMGSWIGPTLLYGCQLAKGAYGIEPDPVAYAELTENVAANRPLTDNVKLCQLCIAPKSGKTPFGSDREAGDSMSSLLFAHGKTRWIVDGQSFEDFIRQNNIRDCSLIKMDIEGGEYSVLPTMVPYLREFRPTLYLSIHPCFLGQPGKLGPVRTVARTMLRLAKTWKLLRCLSFYRYVYDGAGNPLTFWQLLRWSRHDVSHSFVATDREWRVIRTDCPNPPPPP